VADEVWVLLEGEVEFVWHDLRQDYPSCGVWHRITRAEPTLVLAPFGVAFGVRALGGPALLLRLTTHADDDIASEGDQTLPWEEPA
jgi:dTDP-4-dehydrorhamnose 3,5-epimerase-like enzyme